MPGFSFSPRAAIVLAAIAVLASAVVLRIGQTHRPAPADSSTLPVFTSASFSNGDPLTSLGPEWTFVRQADLTSRSATLLDGTAPLREAVAKVIGKNTTLLMTEYRIINKPHLDAGLQTKEKKTVAGRDGYLISTNDIEGGTGFGLVGPTTVLVLQDGTSAAWPDDPAQEILSYVANVTVR